ncbi:hypothetical protein FKM82_007494 [Ascaphus truei]
MLIYLCWRENDRSEYVHTCITTYLHYQKHSWRRVTKISGMFKDFGLLIGCITPVIVRCLAVGDEAHLVRVRWGFNILANNLTSELVRNINPELEQFVLLYQ